MSRTIQVFEHERLTIHSDVWGRQLTQPELDKLYDFNDKNDNIYFTGIRDGIKFKNYVGVIQIGGLTLEILPKADKRQEQSKDKHDEVSEKWQHALLRMLSICRRIRVDSVSEASLAKRHNSILDLYFEIYLNEIGALLRRGLIKKYRRNSGNLLALKGRLDFSHHIQQNLIHQERFYTDHQIYDQDHLINQILHRALIILNQITPNAHLKDRLARIRLDFPDVKHIGIQKHHFDEISTNRKTTHYSEALKIAKMIILNYSPDIKLGQENMLALLFDMNKLWEEYVYRMLVKNKDEGISVKFQNSEVFWETESYKKTIRPDIVVTKGKGKEKGKFIIDTKWKAIDHTKPADDDLKQMYAYNMYWDADLSMLLYPKTSQPKEPIGDFLIGKEGLNQCKLGFVNVLNEKGRLDKEIGRKILKKIEI